MADTVNTSTESKSIVVTKAASDEIKRLMAQEKEENLYMRVGVAAGGCSGMSYTMAFDSEKQPNDIEFDFDGVKVLVENKALSHLNGTILEFKGGLLGGGFAFTNPNARRSCGCGSSFSC
ncbi:MAG TPA: iron-sulfur cluster assembly accessory protein [candidate division Zixibacteria bacterium]|nr:iron-sulfur cluster assembly accessory protein [candidate division Zixibacteria bacterium]